MRLAALAMTVKAGAGCRARGRMGSTHRPDRAPFPAPPPPSSPPSLSPNAPPVSPPGRSQARLILDERFARGEITIEQYRENLKVLGEEP